MPITCEQLRAESRDDARTIQDLRERIAELEASLRPFAAAAPAILESRGPKAMVVDICLFGGEETKPVRAKVSVKHFLAAHKVLK